MKNNYSVDSRIFLNGANSPMEDEKWGQFLFANQDLGGENSE